MYYNRFYTNSNAIFIPIFEGDFMDKDLIKPAFNWDSKKEGSTRAIRVILIATCIVLTFFIFFSWLYTESRFDRKEPLQLNTAGTTLDNWYTIDNGQRNALALPNQFALDSDEITIYRDCSPEEINRGILMVYNMRQQFSVSIDGDKIYELEPAHNNRFTSVNGYNLVKLQPTEKKQQVAITYSMCRNNICSIDSILFCTPSEALVHMIFLDLFNFIMLMLLLILTIVSATFGIYFYIKKLSNPRVHCLFVLLLSICVWILTNMWTSTLLPLSYQTVFHIDYTAFMIIPLPVAIFAYYSTQNYRSKSLLIMTLIALLNVFVQQGLYLLGVYTFYDMLLVTHTLLFATAICAMIAMVRDYRIKKTSRGVLLILTFVLPLVIFIFAMIMFWLLDGMAYNVLFLIGMYGFITLFIWDVIYSILNNIYATKQAQTKLEVFQHLSVKDGLTELNNRRSFDEHLDIIDIGHLDDAILFFLDVNKLKATNDTYGHAAGDELIIGAAKCIEKALGEFGACYRLGGDEFAVIVENPTLEDEEYFQILEDTITEFNIGRPIPLSIAKGCDHLYNRDHIRRNVSLWKSNADKEMYADKMRTKILLDKSESTGIQSENIDQLSGILTLEGFQKNALHIIYHEAEENYALWYFDVKKFKFVNDFFGYELGDRLITYMGRLFLESLHEGETCGRISGNTIVALTKVSKEHTLEEYFNFIQSAIGDFFIEAKVNYKVEIAAGVYLLNEEDKKSPDINQMLDWANVAQKSVKNLSGNRFAIFGEEMWQRQWRDLYINQTLDEAIENGEISVWLQPQYDFLTGRMSGAEALARWTHSSLGWISPGEFIPALEKTGQISKLDYYIWEQACQLMHRWRLSNTMEPISISVNISRLDVMEGNILAKLNSLISKYDLPASSLRLEITESVYMDRPEMLVDVVNELHSNGYTVEMDDFGSGYSSLNMLKDVSVDVLKMDIRFLQGSERKEIGSKIIGAIVQMARELDIPVLTEGVENVEQAKYLSSIGCHLMQGYCFSKPLPVDQFEDLLREEKKKVILSEIESEENLLSGNNIRAFSEVENISHEAKVKPVYQAIYYLGTGEKIVKFDKAFTYLTGYSVEDLEERALTQDDLIPEEDLQSYWKAVRDQAKVANEIILSHRIKCKDGHCITVQCSGLPIIDEYSGESRTRIRIQSTLD